MKCEECKYWVEDKDFVGEDGDPMGLCHRYPPMIFPDGCVAFPVTQYSEWCGEFVQKLDG